MKAKPTKHQMKDCILELTSDYENMYGKNIQNLRWPFTVGVTTMKRICSKWVTFSDQSLALKLSRLEGTNCFVSVEVIKDETPFEQSFY